MYNVHWCVCIRAAYWGVCVCVCVCVIGATADEVQVADTDAKADADAVDTGLSDKWDLSVFHIVIMWCQCDHIIFSLCVF